MPGDASTPRASAADLYVSGMYLEENPDWHAGEARWKAESILRMLARHNISPNTVADIGCGTGDVLARLQPALAPETRLTGYDIAPPAIGIAREKANNALSFQVGMPAQGETFDLALVLDVVEHVENAEGWLRELQGIATHTIFHFPLDLTVHRVIRPGALATIRRRYGHLHFYNREIALGIIAAAGFEVVDWMYTEEFREEGAGTRGERLLSLPRRLSYAVSPDWSVRLMGGCRLLVLAR